jgi:hypothetical protein
MRALFPSIPVIFAAFAINSSSSVTVVRMAPLRIPSGVTSCTF